MGAAPKTVNYRGDVLTEDMMNYLYGEEDFVPGQRKPGGLPADRAQEILSNWMFGFRPRPVDPGAELSRASGLSGVRERASAGMGIAGLFGFGKSIGELPPLPALDVGPMASGVPYSVPPLPKLKPVGG